jgi:alpha-tubulin suppressor-like RCC1 family protein
MRRRRARAPFVVILSSAVLTLGLAGCEWLSGIRDLSAKSADAAPEAARSVDARESGPVADASPVIVPVVPDGGNIALVLARRLALGSTHSCAIRDGRVFCWGGSASGQLGKGAAAQQPDGRAVPSITNAVSIVAGSAHTCALDKDGHVSCWGRAEQGQLGGKPDETGTPVRVALGNDPAIQLAAGAQHTCALLMNKRMRCWGDNGFGQLGNDTNDGGPAPVEPRGMDSVVAMFAGGFFTCALQTSGASYCWGDNGFGQLGDRTKTARPTPVSVRDLSVSAREASIGQGTSCVVAVGGALTCWGRNRSLGDNTPQGIIEPFPGSPSEFVSPTLVGSDAGSPPLLLTIAAGATHACARTIADKAVCWGSNGHSQLAVDTDGGPISGFREITELAGAVMEVAVGLSHSCAIVKNDDVYCWGNNELDQLGAPGSAPRAKPEAVHFAP